MEVRIKVKSEKSDDDATALQTRELLKEIRMDAAPNAKLVVGPPDVTAKGADVTIGEIALSLITGGAIGTLIHSIFEFLGRNRTLSVEIENTDGAKMKLSLNFINQQGFDKAASLAESFLKRDRD